MTTAELCHDEQRRQQVRARELNGLDYVEVNTDNRTLTVFFLMKAPAHIHKENVRIEGGRRITDIKVESASVCTTKDEDRDDCMKVRVDKLGDFSTYQLCVIEVDKDGHPIVTIDEHGRQHYKPMAGFDPRYACVEFSSKAGCATDLDCGLEPACPSEVLPLPEIDYLAKDYASFRQIILDRLALIMPEWRERHVPDIGIALVEVLAYVGDYLSYYQDAVATEAYLDTARQRISVRRHARLVDYLLHEGCNARAWVFIHTRQNTTLKREDVSFVTGRHDGVAWPSAVLRPDDVRSVPRDAYEAFEPLGAEKIHLYTAHNRICFYTWGDRECCLPRGATSATLRDEWIEETPDEQTSDQKKASQQSQTEQPGASKHHKPRKLDQLSKNDLLLFEEVRDPKTGSPDDADPAHRHVVRLTSVTRLIDKLYDQPVVEIEWALEDALPFPLCLSAVSAAPECKYLEVVSVARGNIVLVDHGRTLGRIDPDEGKYEDLGEVPTVQVVPPCKDDDCPAEVETVAGRYQPILKEGPLTFAESLGVNVPAARLLTQDPRHALPLIHLQGNPPGHESWKAWQPRYDLLSSGSEDPHYVVEIDNDSRAHLRFGDGELGRAPQAGTKFRANYRVGNGPVGNVGTKMIRYIVLTHLYDSELDLAPRNPLPAMGGTAPESIIEAKFFAPYAFRNVLERAVTADDYAALAARDESWQSDKRVQRAASALRWTGSWYEALVAVDPIEKIEADANLLHDITARLQAYRRMGHDLTVKPAQYVPLDIELIVCVQPDYLAGHVKAAILDVLSNRRLPDGQLGFFHPDNLTFGDGVYLSKLIATVRAVPGVENVVAQVFQRYHELSNQEIENGVIPLGALEVARLDNDPDFPENGVLKLEMEGGR
ncbi:MAG TPA: putative baseplate assembly protein [Anaerolineae bacterium]|nr:putative baseplate assembly protein [Anaerolineae bacterium]